MRRPRTLEELLEREERLAAQGLTEEAELVGNDMLDLLNVGLHFRRRPVGTSAALAGTIAFLVTRFTKARSRRKVRTYAVNRAPGGSGGGWTAFVRNFVGSSLAGAVLSHLGISGSSRHGAFPGSRHYR
jgi:hypothetical protein